MRMTAKMLAVALLGGSALVVSSGAFAQNPAPPVGVVTPGVSFAPTDQVIVKMRSGQTPNAAALGRASGQSVTNVRNLSAGTIVLKLPSTQSDAVLRATVTALAKAPGVEWAEPDVRMSVTADRLGEQWDLGPATGAPYGINLADVALTNPSPVTVAVVDTGFVPHADLAGQFVGGYDFVDDSRIANDGDGRDDDARDPGDWITSQESRRGSFRGCYVADSSWHGTHVSGTIAALANLDGINGINPNAKILPVRVLGKCGGYTSDITDGVKWAAGIAVPLAPLNENNVAQVVNLSLGGSGACSATWQEAIDATIAAGTTIVVAAGNSNGDVANYSPAGCNNVITVASTGKAGHRAYYSNFGSSVDIAAPGGDRIADDDMTILSTLNTGTTSPVDGAAGDTYAYYQGTSMAAPHVAGVASLVLAANPDLTPGDVATVLTSTATGFPNASSCTSGCGSGIVNAALAVTAAAGTTPTPTTTLPAPTTTTPSADAPEPFGKVGPTNGKSGFRKSVTLSWEQSTGATQYQVCIGVTPTCNTFDRTYSGTSVKFVGLASGTTYYWQVMAVNASGDTLADAGEAWSFTTN